MTGSADDPDDPVMLRQLLSQTERERDAAISARAHDRRESQHLLRNMLAVARSLARRSGDGAASVEEYRSLLDGRLAAFFGVQSTLGLAPERGIDLAGLIGDLLLRFGLKVGAQVELSGDSVRLSARPAGLLALVFHELATDYIASGGGLSGANGLEVRWLYDSTGRDALRIDWHDDEQRARDGDDERSRAWLDWLDQAITYEFDGVTDLSQGPGRQRYTLHLPATCCLPPISTGMP